jgi:hypothetical protein
VPTGDLAQLALGRWLDAQRARGVVQQLAEVLQLVGAPDLAVLARPAGDELLQVELEAAHRPDDPERHVDADDQGQRREDRERGEQPRGQVARRHLRDGGARLGRGVRELIEAVVQRDGLHEGRDGRTAEEGQHHPELDPGENELLLALLGVHATSSVPSSRKPPARLRDRAAGLVS